MSYPDVEQRPAKKRRFFVEDSPVADRALYHEPSLADELNALPEASPATHTTGTVNDDSRLSSSQTDASTHSQPAPPPTNGLGGFDKELFANFVGQDVPTETLEKLRLVAGENMERAINMYLDGSWKTIQASAPRATPTTSAFGHAGGGSRPSTQRTVSAARGSSSPRRQNYLENMPDYRYIGAFGVGAWATRSGTSLVKHGELVKIERTKTKPPVKTGRGGKPVQMSRFSASKVRADIIVRFTNARGEEVGRLPKETAAWVSTLIDQKVCRFEGHCVFAEERVRVNDTIYLQLRCSLLKKAFEAGGFIKPQDNNRTTGIFEEKETSEEKDLRLRQVALVKLFDEINLHPPSVNETTAKHKRQGLLQAAEMAEQYDKDDGKKLKTIENGSSSPPADEDEAEDGKELEQDQLDTLYKKAQSFDFDTPTREPANTFAMDLRKYQKQALHWMMSKEKDEKTENKEVSMHPLWEEYAWPIKDVEDKEVPRVANHDHFYVNPYSGELSLEFPVQEQNCLGGILADGQYLILPEFLTSYANQL